jgi:hypothetical protein
MVKVYRFAPCNKSSLTEFNTSTLKITGGINELNIVGFVNIVKDVPSPIKVRAAEDQFVHSLNEPPTQMMLTAQKCDPRGFKCENNMSLEYPDVCHFLNIPFFAFLKGFEPEIKSCPFRKVIILTLTTHS